MALSKAKTLSAAIFATALAGSAAAATIEHESEALKRTDVELDFSEYGFLGGQVITDQFQSYGVSFSGQMRWLSRIQKRRGTRGATLANFDSDQTINTANPFSVKFDYLVNEVSFGLAANDAVARITALLRGREVGFLETTVNANRTLDNFFGFTGFRMDEILIDFGDDYYGSSFDTLNYSYATDRRGDMIESGVPAVRYRTIFTEPAPEEEGGVLSSSAASAGATDGSSTGGTSQVGSVTAVPLPAAFWMLLAALGGTAAFGARRARS